MNPTLKHLGERALIYSGAARIARVKRRDRTLVLAYHNIVPDGDALSGNLNLHLPQREFARQLDALLRTHDVIPIGAPSFPLSSSGRPRVIITFDDAYAGALTAGIDELVRREIPATVFVTPALLGSVPWWDILAEQTHGVVPDDSQRNALEAFGGNTQAVLRWANLDLATSKSTPTLPHIGNDSQLADAASKPGITLGSHSWSHPNLCTLTENELRAELARPLQWLNSRFATVVPWLSYPYGLFSENVQRVAAEVGYLGGFRIDGGWIPRSSPPPYAIPRFNIPSGLSLNGFRLRLAGL